MYHLKSPEDRWSWRLMLSVYPQKDTGKTILSSTDFHVVYFQFISEADKNRLMMNRLVQCQCRQQSYSKLPDQVLIFWLGYQSDHCSLWLFSMS